MNVTIENNKRDNIFTELKKDLVNDVLRGNDSNKNERKFRI